MRLINFLNESIISKTNIIDLIHKNCSQYLSQVNKSTHLYRGLLLNSDKIYSIKVNKNRQPKDSTIESHNLLNNAFKIVYGKSIREISIFTTGNFDEAEEYGDVFYIFPQGNFSFYWSPLIRDIFKISRWFNKINLKNNENDMYISIFIFKLLEYRNLKNYSLFINDIELIAKIFKDLYFNKLNIDIDLLILKKSFNVFMKKYFNNIDKYIDIGSKNFIYKLYKNTNLIDSINSGNEIMIDCKKYYAISIENKNILDEIWR